MVMAVEPDNPVTVVMGCGLMHDRIAVSVVSLFCSGGEGGAEDAEGRETEDQSFHNQLHARPKSLRAYLNARTSLRLRLRHDD
jgi:hypothetical protein